MTQRLRSLLAGCAEILLLRGSLCGALLLGILFLRPNMAVAGVLSIFAAYGCAWLIGMEAGFRENGYYIYNALFVGLSLGCRFELTTVACLLVIFSGVLTLLVTMLLANVLLHGLRLPVLSLPFVVVSSAAYLATAQYGHALTPIAPDYAVLNWNLNLPPQIAGFFRSCGTILFLPSVVVGALLSLLILKASRILFALAVCGYFLGVTIRGLLLGSTERALTDNYNFTFILIAMAVGGVFLVPSLQSSLMAMIAVAIAPPVVEACTTLQGRLGVPPFTMPFCLVTLGAIYALRAVNYPLLSTGLDETPEAARETSLVNHVRYPGQHRTLCMPFSGEWTVWQAFNGRWTHQGLWRYAYDFLITDKDGNASRNPGGRLQDYYCYGMVVLAPVRGQVIRVVQHLPDNPVGSVDGGNNWGNLVMLYDPRGFYVEISHLIPNSIRVKEGSWVERGTPLGLCGNSGYSPQPHVHIQVQSDSQIGAATLPFSFVNYRQNGCYHANDLPEEQDRVEPLYVEKRLEEVTTFVLDDEHHYEVLHQGRPAGHLHLRTAVTADGTYYFQSDRGRLYFGKHEGTFYFYRLDGDDPFLRVLFLSLPRMPLAYQSCLKWHDYVPVSVATSGLRGSLAHFATFVWPRLAWVPVTQRFCGPDTIESVLEAKVLGIKIDARVELDAHRGFAMVRIGDIQLRRINILPRDTPSLSPATQPNDERSSIVPASTMASLAAVALVVGAVPGVTGDAQTRQAVQQSCEHERGKDYPKAIAALLPQHSAHPQDYLLNLRLGWLSYLSGKYDEAQRYYQAADQASPKSAEAKLGCLLPLLAASKYAEAETLARQTVEADPKSYYGNLRLAVALRGGKKYGEARQIVQRMLAAYPADPYFKGERTQLDAAQNTASGAASAAGDAQIEEALRRSWQCEENRDYTGAIKALLEQHSAHKQDYVLNLRLGWLHYVIGDYRSSSQYYHAAIQATPQAVEAGLGYLLSLLAEGRYADAEAFARQIVQSDPNNYYANLRLAVALRLQGKHDEAEKVLLYMRGLYPADLTLLMELAQVKVAQNDRETAKGLYGDVLSLDPGNSVVTQQLRGL